MSFDGRARAVPDTTAWHGLQLIGPVVEGNRNEVWRGHIGNDAVAVRRSRRSAQSLSWELDVIARLERAGFIVPCVVRTDSGDAHHDDLVVQRWIDGRPPTTEGDWRLVADELERLHVESVSIVADLGQRPGCCTVGELAERRRSVDADLDAIPNDVLAVLQPIFDGFTDAEPTLIHGDPDASNLRITAGDSVGLLDWDESRVDVALHDLSNLGIQVLDDAEHERANRLSHAWEVANAWTAEPGYARRRLRMLDESGRGSGPHLW